MRNDGIVLISGLAGMAQPISRFFLQAFGAGYVQNNRGAVFAARNSLKASGIVMWPCACVCACVLILHHTYCTTSTHTHTPWIITLHTVNSAEADKFEEEENAVLEKSKGIHYFTRWRSL